VHGAVTYAPGDVHGEERAGPKILDATQLSGYPPLVFAAPLGARGGRFSSETPDPVGSPSGDQLRGWTRAVVLRRCIENPKASSLTKSTMLTKRSR
jgi:hypothetical protein